ncbi:MAG: YigZ family protein [Clostridia bacterium]|nr:YigZ family protein [Clostridia bacterium]
MKEYTTITKTETVVENVIEKSRFITSAIGVESVEEAMEFVNAKRKKYFDATHNCFAYIVGDRAKFSDDGEPQGTAGMPIYECIKNNGLDRLCVVVTRYFGGIKLGAGGLVRAYSGGTADVLSKAERLKMTDCIRANAVVDYNLLSIVKRALSDVCLVENVVYSDKVTLQCLFPATQYATIADIVTQNTLGKGIFTQVDRLLCPYKA